MSIGIFLQTGFQILFLKSFLNPQKKKNPVQLFEQGIIMECLLTSGMLNHCGLLVHAFVFLTFHALSDETCYVRRGRLIHYK